MSNESLTPEHENFSQMKLIEEKTNFIFSFSIRIIKFLKDLFTESQ